MSDVKLCKDCAYSKYQSNRFVCSAPQGETVKPDRVAGGVKKSREYSHCDVLRDFEGDKFCGAEAKWFEARVEGPHIPVMVI